MAPRRGAHRGIWPAAELRLVSRDADRQEIERQLLGGDTRLVSLVGAPGSGKTRLALIVAESAADSFADGAAFVDLSVVRDPADVPAAVAMAIGLREPTDHNVGQRIFAWTQRRRFLLLLD